MTAFQRQARRDDNARTAALFLHGAAPAAPEAHCNDS